jgi:hypothetical protein
MTAVLEPVAVGEQPLIDLLERVGEAHPAQVERARRELAASLEPTRQSSVGALAWRASCLTPSRFPVEIAFTSARAELRTVVEVIAPEDNRTTAFDVALGLAGEFGSAGPDPGARRALQRHLQTFTPRFGAWLGSRHQAGSSRHKVYVEVDGDQGAAWRLVDVLAHDARRVIGGLGAVRFVGLPLDRSDVVEIYLRPPELDADALHACLGRAGIGDLAGPMVAAMAGATPDRPSRSLDGRNHGVSVSCVDGRTVAVAGFTFAHQRYRRDHHVREWMLSIARCEGWASCDMYEAASRPLGLPRPQGRPWHTALSEVAAVGSASIEHHVGLAPPPTPPFGPDRSETTEY